MSKIYCLVVSLVAVILCSCNSSKHDLNIFEDLALQKSGVLSVPNTVVRLEPEMELIIIVQSEVQSASAEFNLPYTNPATIGTEEMQGTLRQRTYEVDRNGNIDFPRLGRIHVQGMSLMELKEYLTERISEYVKNPMVTVAITGYRVVVLGEVRNPRTVYSSLERLSVLDALAECGGFGDYALRDNIIVMRRTGDNEVAYQTLDLHDSKVVESPYFWLKNEDVVIVSANNVKQANSKYNQNNGYKLSVISTVVSTVSVIASLVIALTR